MKPDEQARLQTIRDSARQALGGTLVDGDRFLIERDAGRVQVSIAEANEDRSAILRQTDPATYGALSAAEQILALPTIGSVAAWLVAIGGTAAATSAGSANQNPSAGLVLAAIALGLSLGVLLSRILASLWSIARTGAVRRLLAAHLANSRWRDQPADLLAEIWGDPELNRISRHLARRLAQLADQATPPSDQSPR